MLAHRQTHGQKNKKWGLMFCYYWVNEYLNKQKNKKRKNKYINKQTKKRNTNKISKIVLRIKNPVQRVKTCVRSK